MPITHINIEPKAIPSPFNAMAERLRPTRFVVVKVTKNCNLNCTYCYANTGMNKADDYLPLSTFKLMVDLVYHHSPTKPITWLFHGGEPSLLPVSWYEEAWDYLNAKASGKYLLQLQTNAVNLDFDFVDLMKHHSVRTGSSLDGDHEHNINREYFDEAFQGIKILQRRLDKCGVVCVLTRNNVENIQDILSFYEKNELFDIKFNIFARTGRGANIEPVKIHQGIDATLHIARYMLETGGKKVRCSNIKRKMLKYGGYISEDSFDHKTCHTKNCWAGEETICLTQSGNIHPCGRSDNNDDYKLMNISEGVISPNYDQIVNMMQSYSYGDKCDTCNAQSICDFNCAVFAMEDGEWADMDCASNKALFKLFEDNHDEVIDVAKHLYSFDMSRGGVYGDASCSDASCYGD